MILRGWEAFLALKKTKPIGFNQAGLDFQAHQSAIAAWLHDSDRDWFNGSSVLFEYGVFTWLMFKQTHKNVGTVTDEALDRLCAEELALEAQVADESDFTKDR